MRQETESETLEDHCPTPPSPAAPCLAQPASLYKDTSQDHLPRGATPSEKLDPLTSILNQENTPTDISTEPSDRDNFSTEIPSSQMALA